MLKLKKAIYLCVSQTLYIEGNIAMIATLKNATFCQTKERGTKKRINMVRVCMQYNLWFQNEVSNLYIMIAS